VAVFVALAIMTFFGIASTASASAAPPAPPSVSVPVSGETTTGLPVSGTYDLNRFVNRGGELVALGTFTGTAGGQDLTQAVEIPVEVAQTSCEILDLVLGPLDLDLLGLVIQLDTVHLNITAEQGPGNLLGNLLCAVAGLLDGPGGALNGVAALLNRILSILG
jgi:hypothetical protein